MSRRPPGTIKIRSADAATPDRVASLAKLVVETLGAAGVNLADVTLTISNRETRAEVRPYTSEAKGRLALVGDVFENPTRAIREGDDDTARDIAAAVSDADTTIFPSGLEVLRASSRRVLCTIDPAFAKQLGALALATNGRRPTVRGSSQTYSKVLRVGRSREGDPTPQARIEFKGRFYDVPFATNLDATPIFHALQTRGFCRIWLETAWTREKDGTLKLQERGCRIIRALPFEPVTGKEFLGRARPLFDVPADAVETVREGRGDT